ncbi:hypothetical protein AURDEDRAFT_61115 [Auricularia subglabra TFB-10046 SS5]|nr:hypothetical protein AURDEDRAFT_61115 [Auricularia subglabra TFB-10046 SS5]
MPPPSSSTALHLRLLPETFAIFQLGPGETIPANLLESVAQPDGRKFISITRTKEEVSVVCDRALLDSEQIPPGEWKCIQVIGPMDLTMTGILAAVSQPLKEAGVPIFVVSTWNTDWLLVPAKHAEEAVQALEKDLWTFP